MANPSNSMFSPRDDDNGRSLSRFYWAIKFGPSARNVRGDTDTARKAWAAARRIDNSAERSSRSLALFNEQVENK